MERMVLAAHVEDLDRGQGTPVDSAWQTQPLQPKDALRARSGAARKQDRSMGAGPPKGNRAGVVARVALVLVGGVVLLVDHDQPEVRDRREHRGAGTDAHPGVALAQPAPLGVALGLGEAGVEHRHRVAEPFEKAPHDLRGQ